MRSEGKDRIAINLDDMLSADVPPIIQKLVENVMSYIRICSCRELDCEHKERVNLNKDIGPLVSSYGDYLARDAALFNLCRSLGYSPEARLFTAPLAAFEFLSALGHEYEFRIRKNPTSEVAAPPIASYGGERSLFTPVKSAAGAPEFGGGAFERFERGRSCKKGGRNDEILASFERTFKESGGIFLREGIYPLITIQARRLTFHSL